MIDWRMEKLEKLEESAATIDTRNVQKNLNGDKSHGAIETHTNRYTNFGYISSAHISRSLKHN